MKKLFKVDSDKEAFELVSKHLLEQGARCGNDYDCYYDGSQFSEEFHGMKCAIGALMTDEALERLGNTLGGLRSLEIKAQKLDFEEGNLNAEMLSDLQRVHDEENEIMWKSSLEKIKIKYNL